MKLLVTISVMIATTLALPTVDSGNGGNVQGRIAGGRNAKASQFPYQVGLDILKWWSTTGEWDEWCGGSLITDKLVITAAHCLRRAVSADVWLGMINMQDENEPGSVRIKVKKDNFIIHEEYDHYLLRNDIALIKLPGRVSTNSRIQPINLPRLSQRNADFVNELGWVSGWGLIGQDEDQPDILQYAQRMVLPDSTCEIQFSLFRKEVQMCVDGSRGISSCPGDSGGPLAIQDSDGSKMLVGLVSFGKPKGCGKGFPSAYTRITTFLDWIQEKGGITLRE